MTEKNAPPDQGYEHFYTKFHDLSEQALGPCYYIRDSLKVIQSYAEKNPGLFPDPETQIQLKAFSALAREFGVTLRGFFWPRTGDDLQRDILLSLERWQPYDQAAWETVLQQLTAMIVPYHAQAQGYLQTLYTTLQSQPAGMTRIQDFVTLIENHLQRLAQLCTPAGK